MQVFTLVFAQATTSAAAPAVSAASATQTTATTQQPAAASGAGKTPPPQNSLPMTGFMLLAMFAVLYFFMIRPQNKQRKEHENLLAQLKAGDRVVTASGIYGSIVSVSDKSFMLRVADNAVIEIARPAVTAKIDEA